MTQKAMILHQVKEFLTLSSFSVGEIKMSNCTTRRKRKKIQTNKSSQRKHLNPFKQFCCIKLLFVFLVPCAMSHKTQRKKMCTGKTKKLKNSQEKRPFYFLCLFSSAFFLAQSKQQYEILAVLWPPLNNVGERFGSPAKLEGLKIRGAGRFWFSYFEGGKIKTIQQRQPAHGMHTWPWIYLIFSFSDTKDFLQAFPLPLGAPLHDWFEQGSTENGEI